MVGGWKWRNIKCMSCKFTHGNLPFPTVDKTFYNLAMSFLMPHLAGIVYRDRAEPKSVSRGLLAAPTVCAGMCQGLHLGWDTMTSGNRMGGCDSTRIEKERSTGR